MSYPGRSVRCLKDRTEVDASWPDRRTEVSRGRTSRASDEGPNGARKGVTERSRTRAMNDGMASDLQHLKLPPALDNPPDGGQGDETVTCTLDEIDSVTVKMMERVVEPCLSRTFDFEATAEPNQTAKTTAIAVDESLEVKTFDVAEIPENMIFKDRERIELAIADTGFVT